MHNHKNNTIPRACNQERHAQRGLPVLTFQNVKKAQAFLDLFPSRHLRQSWNGEGCSLDGAELEGLSSLVAFS